MAICVKKEESDLKGPLSQTNPCLNFDGHERLVQRDSCDYF